ncbi:MAG: hypothetical protein WBD87_02350 [Candidatus Acidiferrales bacterium]
MPKSDLNALSLVVTLTRTTRLRNNRLLSTRRTKVNVDQKAIDDLEDALRKTERRSSVGAMKAIKLKIDERIVQ